VGQVGQRGWVVGSALRGVAARVKGDVKRMYKEVENEVKKKKKKKKKKKPRYKTKPAFFFAASQIAPLRTAKAPSLRPRRAPTGHAWPDSHLAVVPQSRSALARRPPPYVRLALVRLNCQRLPGLSRCLALRWSLQARPRSVPPWRYLNSAAHYPSQAWPARPSSCSRRGSPSSRASCESAPVATAAT